MDGPAAVAAAVRAPFSPDAGPGHQPAVLALNQLQGRTPVVWTITALVAAVPLPVYRTGLVR